MKNKLCTAGLWVCFHTVSLGQQVFDLYSEREITAKPTGGTELVTQDPVTGNRTVLNVTKPSITIYRPEKNANKTAVLICPGGAFHILDVDNEGYNLAKLLVQKGYTAVVLKYRLVPINMQKTNPLGELGKLAADFKALEARMAPDIPIAISDGKAAMQYVQKNAERLGIDPDKVGIIGFSAGGTIAAAVAYDPAIKPRPAFAAPIYPYLAPLDKEIVPSKAPPLFIAVAADDDFKFDDNSAKMHQKWKNAGALTELHIYTSGKHGFGTKKQNLPVDHWLDRFTEWLSFLGMDK